MKNEKKKREGYMTADEWFEIEDKYSSADGWTMEEIAAMGPEGRQLMREGPFNPYFPKPDLSMYDESLYDGYKIRNKDEKGN